MEKLLGIGEDLLAGKINIDDLKREAHQYNLYPESIYKKDGSILFMVKLKRTRHLVVLGKGVLLDEFEGDYILSNSGKICPLNNFNSKVLRRHFPFTAPLANRTNKTSIGLGDRLGLASPGHIKLVKEYDVFPVLAQQSIRELNLTGRDYKEVLDAASWAVFQENYQSGYGADGDHLKSFSEVKMALDCGFTMITLDCSDFLDSSANHLKEEELAERYSMIDKSVRNELEDRYLNKTFLVGEDLDITFEELDFMRIVLIYLDAISFASEIYRELISQVEKRVDFEVSIDETSFPTSIPAHFFIASELQRNDVKLKTLAPRFLGEFQKGIDYIGDMEAFKENFYQHFLIAKRFGYKISVHSGSDKFTIFPIVGDITQGEFHLKTAGTNWLEAMRVIAHKDTHLFREVFAFAVKKLEKAKAYYHIDGDPDKLPPLRDIRDEDLVGFLDNKDARQILHITYGLILEEKDSSGKYVFKDRIYNLLKDYENLYDEFLNKHIGRHLEGLMLERLG